MISTKQSFFQNTLSRVESRFSVLVWKRKREVFENPYITRTTISIMMDLVHACMCCVEKVQQERPGDNKIG